MKKTGVIVIEGHVQGLSNTRALGEAGIPVIVVDTGACVARHSRHCRAFYRCPPYDSDELAEFLIDLAQKQGLEGWLLLPSNDHAVHSIARNRDRLAARFKLITPEMAVVRNIYDKARLLKLAQAINVPIPATHFPSETDQPGQSLTYPVLTRGCYGLDFYKATGKKAFLAHSAEELSAQLGEIQKAYPLERVLTQELIPDVGTNKTISFTAFCVGGEIKTYWMGEKVRQHPLQFGTATFARSVNVPDCLAHSIPLLKALDYTGICEVEYLRDPRDGQYKLIEINARTWLWVGLARACGVDFAKLAYDYVNSAGGEIGYPTGYETGVCWLNPVTDGIYSLLAMMKGRLTPVDYLNSIKRNKIITFATWRDLKPFFVYLSLTVNYLKRR